MIKEKNIIYHYKPHIVDSYISSNDNKGEQSDDEGEQSFIIEDDEKDFTEELKQSEESNIDAQGLALKGPIENKNTIGWNLISIYILSLIIARKNSRYPEYTIDSIAKNVLKTKKQYNVELEEIIEYTLSNAKKNNVNANDLVDELRAQSSCKEPQQHYFTNNVNKERQNNQKINQSDNLRKQIDIIKPELMQSIMMPQNYFTNKATNERQNNQGGLNHSSANRR
jgi:hypothetical protein